MRRRALIGLVAVLAVAGAGVLGLWALQRRLVYFPDRRAPDVAVVGAGWEEVALTTSDGFVLGAWWRSPDSNGPVIIVFNGNAGNRADRVDLGRGLAAAGSGVLLTDYRGYGGNPGHPTETGLAADARAARAFVDSRVPGRPVVYFGESLGAAVAIGLATEAPPAALVLRSPFTSLAAVGREHYPWLPLTRFLKDRYPSLDRIGTIDVPTLVIAGDADSIIPVGQSREIYAAAAGPKELMILPGADHNDAVLVAGPDVLDAVAAFLADR